jgi:tRNA threonylcarbamoyladenosine biosynthesis protein TsaE
MVRPAARIKRGRRVAEATEPEAKPITFELADETATNALAARLADVAREGDVVALWGDLGSGKSVFARAFIRAKTTAGEDVPSPTFTLVQSYPSGAEGPTIHHFDLFRLSGPAQVEVLDIDDAIATGICLIEWPDRLGPFLPGSRLDVHLAYATAEAARIVRLVAHGDWKERLRRAGLA